VNSEQAARSEPPQIGAGAGLQTLFTVYCSLFTLLSACGGLSPLRGHAVVGRDAYEVFVGDGPGGQPDLFGVRADGGPVFQITYSSVAEAGPVLSPDGGAVAFLRSNARDDRLSGRVWVLNLLSGAERELPLPRDSPRPERLGWSGDGRSLYVRAGPAIYRLNPPPAAPDPGLLAGVDRAVAESSLAVFLGDPPFGRVLACAQSLCSQTDSGPPAPFASNAHDAVRWGPDSVGFLSGADLIVRPVGPGRARRVEWSDPPAGPRQLSFFPGKSANGAP